MPVNAIYTLWAIGIGMQHGTVGQALWVGLPLLAASAMVWVLARGSVFTRMARATLAMALVSLHRSDAATACTTSACSSRWRSCWCTATGAYRCQGLA